MSHGPPLEAWYIEAKSTIKSSQYSTTTPSNPPPVISASHPTQVEIAKTRLEMIFPHISGPHAQSWGAEERCICGRRSVAELNICTQMHHCVATRHARFLCLGIRQYQPHHQTQHHRKLTKFKPSQRTLNAACNLNNRVVCWCTITTNGVVPRPYFSHDMSSSFFFTTFPYQSYMMSLHHISSHNHNHPIPNLFLDCTLSTLSSSSSSSSSSIPYLYTHRPCTVHTLGVVATTFPYPSLS